MIDALGFERHFVDHLAPVWAALPPSVRGRFVVEADLVPYARSIGIDPLPMDGNAIRASQPPPGPRFDGAPALVASVGDVKIGRRLGYGPFVYLEHGAGQGYESRAPAGMESYAGGPGREDNAVFLVPNEYSARRWRAAYPDALVEVIGSPHLDDLPARDAGPGPTVAVSFHWQGVSSIPYSGNALGDFWPALPYLARKYTVLGHAHPRYLAVMDRIYRRAGIEVVPDFADVCRRADVYVADNTSTLFEFAATGRPVVVMNAREWHKGHGPGLRFWDAAGVGVNVDHADSLLGAVERALEERPDDVARREAALDVVYAYRTGAAGRAARVITAWLGNRAEVAA